ncbi:hypothetical protein OIE62_11575 [Streptomyces scopuliridis]|uniref:Uncharacterized protein n=1 Tax=Streptomyces scopuliridis TaxID=452529 RepID=A0ACD4ZR90_9ACTN|nr:hypothetical protein [Streptomyces scopuliridis]WSC00796.1 hypothetical protein OG835_29820 [Streptomyces scopuliridis]WSC05593.1 hypothetical protein OIE62_11575 [Streptomyces scopuliridis]
MNAPQAIEVLEDHATVPRDEVQRNELFAALAVLRILALGGDRAESD